MAHHTTHRTGRARRRTLVPVLALALALALSAPAGLTSPATAASLPDLVVAALAPASGSVARGSTLVVKDTTANVGRRRAAGSVTRFYLSKDTARGAGDRLLGSRKVSALAPGSRQKSSTRLTVPVGTPATGYHVLACADANRRVKEAKEGNNCRATRGLVSVTEPSDGQFPMDPDPLTVHSTLETDRAVTWTAYPFAVNEITATGSDGTTYTLVVPKDALVGAEDITMTPLATVSDLPLSGGLKAGVRLEPEGLLLLKPATLTITRPGGLGDLGQQTAFQFHHGGADFHLYPMAAPKAGDDQDTVRLSLTHFSTPGIGSGTAADRSAVQAHVPERTSAQYESVISEALRAERASVEQGNPPDPGVGRQVLDTLDQYFDDVVRDRLRAAEADATLASSATGEGLAWTRQVQLLGDADNPRVAETMDRIERIWRHALDYYWNKCTAQNDLASISMLMAIARWASLFGWTWQDEAFDKAKRCSNFEVRFDSLITSSYADPPGGISDTVGQGRWHLESSVEVPWTGSAFGPMHYTEFAFHQRITYLEESPGCPDRYVDTTGTTTEDGTMLASIQPELNPREIVPAGVPQPPPPPVARVFLALGTSQTASDRPEETYHEVSHQCTETVTDVIRTEWYDGFTRLHDSRSQLTVEVRADDQVGDLLLAKEWDSTAGDGSDANSATETTRLEVWHRPLT